MFVTFSELCMLQDNIAFKQTSQKKSHNINTLDWYQLKLSNESYVYLHAYYKGSC